MFLDFILNLETKIRYVIHAESTNGRRDQTLNNNLKMRNADAFKPRGYF